MSYEFLQEYWWFLISLLGGCLVFLLFVQGAQSMFLQPMSEAQRERMVDTVAHRWELTFTTLVVFGGAFFASFPLFYSTSFGGAYWVWMLILFGFVVQAVSYKYRRAEGNLLGRKTYDFFLFLNGILAPVLLGGAVSTFFFGSDFTIEKSLIAHDGGVISQWGPLHGLEVLADWRVVVFGLMVLFLSRILANLWYLNQISDDLDIRAWNRRQLLINAIFFVPLFLVVVGLLVLSDGYETMGEHQFRIVENKYFHNLFGNIICLVFFLVGVVNVLNGIIMSLIRHDARFGIWVTGLGTIMVVMSLFWVAGYFNTPYYPSATDLSSSLTIYNSSSSEFTLQAMSVVSLFIPFVLAYIVWVWRKFTK